MLKQKQLRLHTCQLFLFWRNSSSFRSKKKNDFIMCSCFCSNLCIVMYRKFRNVPLFNFFSLICSSFWNLKVGKYEIMMSCTHLKKNVWWAQKQKNIWRYNKSPVWWKYSIKGSPGEATQISEEVSCQEFQIWVFRMA